MKYIFFLYLFMITSLSANMTIYGGASSINSPLIENPTSVEDLNFTDQIYCSIDYEVFKVNKEEAISFTKSNRHYFCSNNKEKVERYKNQNVFFKEQMIWFFSIMTLAVIGLIFFILHLKKLEKENLI